jgi:Protein of unknown function (DUF3048) C-terminal domain
VITCASSVASRRSIRPTSSRSSGAASSSCTRLVSIDPYSEYDHARPDVANIGSGKAIVFQEGSQIAATWKKASNTDLTRFYDSSGSEIELVRGEIFMQSIPATYAVTVKQNAVGRVLRACGSEPSRQSRRSFLIDSRSATAGRLSSVVEQRFRKPQVQGSNP